MGESEELILTESEIDSVIKRGRGRPRNPEGRKVTTKGYVIVRLEDGSWRGEHTLAMEEALGRTLIDSEFVRHLNGNKLDNRIENLELCVGRPGSGIRVSDLQCPSCGSKYVVADGT